MTTTTTATATAPSAGGISPKRPLRVLIVEDHADTLLMLQRVLGWEDYEVVTARGFDEALRAGLATTPDVLVADVRLPDGSGWQLLPRLRAAHPGLVGVAASGVATADVAARSEQAGYSLHLPKPIDLARLCAALQSCGVVEG